jgi:DedD protein
MEQKKLLLVAISVGIFLVIVIGAAMLALGSGNSVSSAALAAASRPRPIPPGAAGTAEAFPPAVEPGYAQGTAPQTPADPAELPRSPEAIPGLNAGPDGAPLQQNNFYINGSPEKVSPGETGETGTPRTVITVAPRTAAGVPDEPPAGRAVSRPPAAPAASRPAQTTASRPAAQAARPPVQAKPAAAPAKAPEPARVYDNYWVQTGSFSVKARAEGVKETLASKGISSIIENREVNGKTFFRVRVGPYTSQEEADYWLPLIRSINGFENSQVWKTQSRR